MSISKWLYPSYDYIDYNTSTIVRHFASDNERFKYAFGEQKASYSSTGYIDDSVILMSDLSEIIFSILCKFTGNKIMKQEENTARTMRTYTTEIILFPKKVTSITGPNIRIEVNITGRSYDEDKVTPTTYGGNHHKWTLLSIMGGIRLRNGTTNVFSTSLGFNIDDNWVRGNFELPYGDSLSVVAERFDVNYANYCLYPPISNVNMVDSASFNEYLSNLENFTLIDKNNVDTDTRWKVTSIINLTTTVKSWLTKWYNTGGYINNADVPEPVDDDLTGNGDDSSDYIPSGDLPTINSFASGLISAYTMETGALSSLSNFLWDDNFIESLPKLVNNPMDAIICLKSYPINLSAYGSTANIKIGGIDTEISATKVNTQYVLIDCGILDVHEYYGDFTDYDNTTVLINLPYVGEHVLPSDEVLESTLHLYYKVDLLSGSCMAQVEVVKNRFGTILQGSIYNFKGNLSTDYPLTGQIYGNIINALNGLFTTNFAMALNSANNIVNGERKIEINGNHSSNYGALGTQVPYIKIVSPIQNNPSSYNRDFGAYANQTAKIASLKGYTEISAANLSIAGATESEIAEIKSLLYNGVIIN